jgi:hypothetical protein
MLLPYIVLFESIYARYRGWGTDQVREGNRHKKSKKSQKICDFIRLRKQRISFKQQYPIDIHDEDGTPLGHLVADAYQLRRVKAPGQEAYFVIFFVTN